LLKMLKVVGTLLEYLIMQNTPLENFLAMILYLSYSTKNYHYHYHYHYLHKNGHVWSYLISNYLDQINDYFKRIRNRLKMTSNS